MNELEDRLKEADAAGARFKLIATDGVFSMDGYVAKLKEICALADRYGALVLVDDCHATGHLGEKGRGTPALTGAGDRVDIVTGTFGKTLGGGMGGFVAAAQPIVDLLRQRARPYLFSNSLAPPVAAGALKALEIAIDADDRRELLQAHARRFRAGVEKAGFKVLPGETPIIPVMLGDARLAQDLAQALDERGVFVAGFFFPVVPKGAARIRTQMSAALNSQRHRLRGVRLSPSGQGAGIVVAGEASDFGDVSRATARSHPEERCVASRLEGCSSTRRADILPFTASDVERRSRQRRSAFRHHRECRLSFMARDQPLMRRSAAMASSMIVSQLSCDAQALQAAEVRGYASGSRQRHCSADAAFNAAGGVIRCGVAPIRAPEGTVACLRRSKRRLTRQPIVRSRTATRQRQQPFASSGAMLRDAALGASPRG